MKKTLKIVLTFLLAASFVLSLSACSSNNIKNDTNPLLNNINSQADSNVWNSSEAGLENTISSNETISTSNALNIIKNATLQYPSSNDEFKYNVYDTYIQITKCINKEAENITFPSTIDGLPVLVVGSLDKSAYTLENEVCEKQLGKFSKKSLKFSEGIAIIGKEAFCNNEVEEVILPSSLLEIHTLAFSGCRIKSINFPEGLKVIEKCAFEVGIDSGVEIVLPKTLETVGERAFLSGEITITFLNPNTQIESENYGSGGVWNKKAIICGYKNSTAAAVAARYNNTFKLIED